MLQVVSSILLVRLPIVVTDNINYYIMLRWTIIFIVIAIVAAILGFGGVAGAAAGIAKIIFFIFLVLFILSLLRGVVKR